MSTHADPRKDKYLDLEKRLAAAEYEFAADLADADKALRAAEEKGKKTAKAAPPKLKRKPAA